MNTEEFDFSELESRIIVANMMDPREWSEIEWAALHAHQGDKAEAERCRHFAGYGNLSGRRDADYVRPTL